MKKIMKDFYRVYSNGVGALLTKEEAVSYYSNLIQKQNAMDDDKDYIYNVVNEEINMIRSEDSRILIPRF